MTKHQEGCVCTRCGKANELEAAKDAVIAAASAEKGAWVEYTERPTQSGHKAWVDKHAAVHAAQARLDALTSPLPSSHKMSERYRALWNKAGNTRSGVMEASWAECLRWLVEWMRPCPPEGDIMMRNLVNWADELEGRGNKP